MPLTLRGLSRIEYLVSGQVLFSSHCSKNGLHGGKQLGAKYEKVSLPIICINTKHWGRLGYDEQFKYRKQL